MHTKHLLLRRRGALCELPSLGRQPWPRWEVTGCIAQSCPRASLAVDGGAEPAPHTGEAVPIHPTMICWAGLALVPGCLTSSVGPSGARVQRQGRLSGLCPLRLGCSMRAFPT